MVCVTMTMLKHFLALCQKLQEATQIQTLYSKLTSAMNDVAPEVLPKKSRPQPDWLQLMKESCCVYLVNEMLHLQPRIIGLQESPMIIFVKYKKNLKLLYPSRNGDFP